MAAVVPASSARAAPMTANLRMAPPYLYRTCRLVQIGGSHVQQSAPSRHLTLDIDDLIHAQSKQHFTPALPHPRSAGHRTLTGQASHHDVVRTPPAGNVKDHVSRANPDP